MRVRNRKNYTMHPHQTNMVPIETAREISKMWEFIGQKTKNKKQKQQQTP